MPLYDHAALNPAPTCSPVAPEREIDRIQSRLNGLAQILENTAGQLDVTANRVLGAPPTAGEETSVAPPPAAGQIAGLHQTIDWLEQQVYRCSSHVSTFGAL